jgi:hypothetical protein
MHFVPSGCSGHDALRDLARLNWILAEFEAPEPVAIDVSRCDPLSPQYVKGFFLPICEEPPSAPYGPHPIIVIGASEAIADTILECLGRHGYGIAIQRR